MVLHHHATSSRYGMRCIITMTQARHSAVHIRNNRFHLGLLCANQMGLLFNSNTADHSVGLSIDIPAMNDSGHPTYQQWRLQNATTLSCLASNSQMAESMKNKHQTPHNLHRQKTRGTNAPIATNTGSIILLVSSEAYGSATLGPATGCWWALR